MNDPFHPIKVEEAKRAILELVAKRGGHITFGELNLFLPASQGDLWYSFKDAPNLVLWDRLSQTFAQALAELMQEKRLNPHPSSVTGYLNTGYLPQLPMAKSPRNYKEPHWYPVTLDPSPLEA